MARRPVLIADAGFMYAAKMSGQAPEYDLFTPDVGELAFLADETAPHPFYTRGFILHEDNRVPDLVARAYAHDNAARFLLVKGSRDYLAGPQGIVASVDHPNHEAMEAIGGTGDTLIGIVAALVAAGYEINSAAILAARTNRMAGHLAQPTPATQVLEIIRRIPAALEMVLRQ
jgi:NAD(P)H-hydrate repair Nnr-like enzyme with NAD(P)H-hydrate dehydratase domain